MWLLDCVVGSLSDRLPLLRLPPIPGIEMILSTHAIVGAALASFLPAHPIGAFVIGFGSHFALDAIPHWDYPIRSRSVDPRIGAPLVFDSALRRDALTIGSDAFFGIVIALLLFGSRDSFWAVLLGAIGAILPDPLQFLHARWPHGPLQIHQRFHRWAHTNKKIDSVPLGVGTQIMLVVAVVAFTTALHQNIFGTVFTMARCAG
jgi:hypothetical protein